MQVHVLVVNSSWNKKSVVVGDERGGKCVVMMTAIGRCGGPWRSTPICHIVM